MKNLDLDYIWKLVLIVMTLTVFTIFMRFIVSEKRVVAYELGSYNTTTISINANVENGNDYSIVLVNTSYEQAIEYVNKLNKDLKENSKQ